MTLKHYYHIYCNGEWQSIVEEHLKNLRDSGLLDALSEFNVGIVGDRKKRLGVKLALREYNISIVAEADLGFEQETLDQLHRAAQEDPPFKVLYAHTKGSSNPASINFWWRQDMEEDNILNWEKAASLLDEYKIVGSYWVPRLRIFAGNFWWANSSYLATLSRPGRTSRFDAEGWIREGNLEENFFCLRDGFPNVPLPRHNLTLNKEINNMIVTFRCDGKVDDFKPGNIYTDVLTPQLERHLRNGANLVLIDPLTLDRTPEPEVVVPVLIHVSKEALEEIKEKKEECEPAKSVVRTSQNFTPIVDSATTAPKKDPSAKLETGKKENYKNEDQDSASVVGPKN